jgi:ligand-binding SRPBCC domain-containing protein
MDNSDGLTKIRFRSRISAPAQEVYSWYAEPEALQRLQPPWEKAKVIGQTGGIEDFGSQVTIQISIGPIKLNWVAEHVACEPGQMFRDMMIRGPFRQWEHSHLFLQDPDDPESSWIEDRIRYELPLGWLGKLVAGGWTHRRLKRLFTWRHQTTIAEFASRARKRD